MTKHILLTFCLCIASIAAPPVAFSQDNPEDEQAQNRQTDPKNTPPPFWVNIAALGHQRMIQIERTQAPKVIRFKTPDGEDVEMEIPAGAPLEVKGKEFEYLPSTGYFYEKFGKEEPKFHRVPLILNRLGGATQIARPSKLSLLIQSQEAIEGQQELAASLKTYASAPIEGGQTHSLMVLVKRFQDQEPWRNPVVRHFDISPSKMPTGAALFFNGCPFEMEMEISSADGRKSVERLKPFNFKLLKAGDGESDVSLNLVASLVAKNGNKQQFYYNSIRIPRNQRSFVFSYYDPRKDAASRAAIVTSSEPIPQAPVPQAPNNAVSRASTPR